MVLRNKFDSMFRIPSPGVQPVTPTNLVMVNNPSQAVSAHRQHRRKCGKTAAFHRCARMDDCPGNDHDIFMADYGCRLRPRGKAHPLHFNITEVIVLRSDK
jgi:hypothetical protein